MNINRRKFHFQNETLSIRTRVGLQPQPPAPLAPTPSHFYNRPTNFLQLFLLRSGPKLKPSSRVLVQKVNSQFYLYFIYSVNRAKESNIKLFRTSRRMRVSGRTSQLPRFKSDPISSKLLKIHPIWTSYSTGFFKPHLNEQNTILNCFYLQIVANQFFQKKWKVEVFF